MKILAVIGKSGRGKTRLIQRLLPELKKRGFSAAVIKHCAHGFDLDVKSKDSWQMMEAGAEGVAMVSPDRLAVLRKTKNGDEFQSLAARYFRDADIVIIEGGYGIKGLKAIEVLAEGSPAKALCDPNDLIGVVSRLNPDIGRPVFRPGQAGEIADFLVSDLPAAEMPVNLEVDGRPVPLNAFVQKTFENVIVAQVESLRGIREEPSQITLHVVRGQKTRRKR